MRPHPAVSRSNEALFVKVVRAAFAHRRKTVINSLRNEGFALPQLTDAFATTTINASRRAETLSIDEFAAIANALATVSPSLL
jgi:16S rRNA (adenine1518-N6/adenine1519-N6)-dimethyltransferase